MADNVRGWNRLMAKLAMLNGDQIADVASRAAYNCALANTAAAKKLAPVDSGELRFEIMTQVETNQNGVAVGISFTNSDHAVFVEFGTGWPGATSSYNAAPIQVDYALGPYKVKRGNFVEGQVVESYEDYWVYFDESKQQYFATRGQPARPYMYPAAKEVEKQAKSIQAAALRKFLKQLGV